MGARDYYKELLAHGGLNPAVSAYTCFKDEPSPDFFTFTDTAILREGLRQPGMKPLPREQQKLLAKDWVAMTWYHSGVADKGQMYLDADMPGSYIVDLIVKGFKMRARFSFTEATLRYIYSAEHAGETIRSSTGKCERIP